jgi:outer membrane protein OmpA-like peptidoglycan-associated protein
MGLLDALGLRAPAAIAAGVGRAIPASPRLPGDAARPAPPRAVAARPGPAASVESPGHKEASWARPSSSAASSPVHVASIFFRTKDSTLDATDEALLASLAKAYAPYAKRNIGVPRGALGLAGRVVGYADPRRSVEPDNQKLSAARAEIVARRLVRHLAAESGIAEGHFDIPWQGAGAQQAEPGPNIEANKLAPFRRADVYLAGQGQMPEPAAPPAQGKPPAPPPMKEVEHDWGDFDAPIAKGAKREILAMAARMLTFAVAGVTGKGDSPTDRIGYLETAMALAIPRQRRSEFPQSIDAVKPPWWDSRGAGIGASQGRNAAKNVLVAKAKMLQRDWVEVVRYEETYVDGPKGAIRLLLAEVKRDDPDPAKVREYVKTLSYARFMWEAIADEAREVAKLCKS